MGTAARARAPACTAHKPALCGPHWRQKPQDRQLDAQPCPALQPVQPHYTQPHHTRPPAHHYHHPTPPLLLCLPLDRAAGTLTRLLRACTMLLLLLQFFQVPTCSTTTTLVIVADPSFTDSVHTCPCLHHTYTKPCMTRHHAPTTALTQTYNPPLCKDGKVEVCPIPQAD